MVIIIECVAPKVYENVLKSCHKTETVMVIIYESWRSYLDAETLKNFRALKHWNAINYWMYLPRMDEKTLEMYHIAESMDVVEYWVCLTCSRWDSLNRMTALKHRMVINLWVCMNWYVQKLLKHITELNTWWWTTDRCIWTRVYEKKTWKMLQNWNNWRW